MLNCLWFRGTCIMHIYKFVFVIITSPFSLLLFFFVFILTITAFCFCLRCVDALFGISFSYTYNLSGWSFWLKVNFLYEIWCFTNKNLWEDVCIIYGCVCRYFLRFLHQLWSWIRARVSLIWGFPLTSRFLRSPNRWLCSGGIA